jgi:hypothetical protein
MDEIPGPILQPGQKVWVKLDAEFGQGPWPAQPFGTVSEHPLAEAGVAWVLTMTTSGLRRTYWIVFDEMQFDVDGDGPYPMSEVLDIYLEGISPTV